MWETKPVAAACLRSRRLLLLVLRKSPRSCDGPPLLRCLLLNLLPQSNTRLCVLKSHVSRWLLRVSCGGFKLISLLQNSFEKHGQNAQRRAKSHLK